MTYKPFFTKTILFFFYSFLSFLTIKAQPGIIGDGFSTGWNNPTDIIQLTPSFGESYMLVLKPKAIGDQYFRWVKGTSELSPSTTCITGEDKYINNTDIAVLNAGSSNCTNSKWYIQSKTVNDNFIFKVNASNFDDFFVARIAGNIRTVESVSHSPSDILVGENVLVTSTLSGTFPVGQRAYLRYSKDNFISSTIVEMTTSGTSCTATIPANYNSLGTVQYYVFTSGVGIPTSFSSKADFFAINQNDNEGAYYSYNIGSGSTYEWTGTTNNDWQNSSNWSPERIPFASDILIFNNGITNNITNVPTQNIGSLQVLNNTIVNLKTSLVSTLNINNGVIGSDLIVASNSQLNINSSYALKINLNSYSTASVNGSMTFSNAAHSINAISAGAITFNSGSSLTQENGFTGNIFTTTGTENIAIFKSGSIFLQKAGSHPFGFQQPRSKVVLESGNLYIFQVASNATDPSLSGRVFADFEFNPPANSKARTSIGTTGLTVDNIKILSDTLNINISNTSTVKGGIFVATGAVLNFTPTATANINLTNTTPQSITNLGTFTIGSNANVVIPVSSTIQLNSNITTNGTLTVNGTLNMLNSIINGAGNFAMGTGASLSTNKTNGITGSLATTNTPTFASNNNFTYNGSTNQVEGSLLPNTVGSITINNAASSVSFSKDLTLSNALTFAVANKANIEMGSNILKISSPSISAISRQGEGFVIGKLQQTVANGTNTYTLPIGTSSGYTPMSINFTNASGSGDISVQSIDGQHPQMSSFALSQTDYLNRYWLVKTNNLTFEKANVEFKYLSTDLKNDATFNTLKMAQYNGSSWSYPSVSVSENSISATNLTSLNDFAAAICNTETTISSQSKNKEIEENLNVELSVNATGINLTYQWLKDGQLIPNETNSTLTISSAKLNDSGNYTAVITGLCGQITSESIKLKVIQASPLPIELLSFEGYTEGGINKLKWVVASQQNVSHFIIEHSSDVKKWIEITQQLKAAGTTNNKEIYFASDLKPISSAYYRLKSVDFDGKTQYSNVIHINRNTSKATNFILFPNPTNSEINVQFESLFSQKIDIEILDIVGRSLKTTRFEAAEGINNIKIDFKDLPKGLYFLKTQFEGKTAVEKIIKR